MNKSIFKRSLALLMAVLMLLTMFPTDIFPTVSSSESGTAVGRYTAQIGKTARFNEAEWGNFIVTDEPFPYDGSTVDYDQIIDSTGIPDDLVLMIVDVYHETEEFSLWYKLTAAPGFTMPETLGDEIWVFQNWTNYSDTDSLLISEPENYVFDANGEALTEAVVSPSEKVELRADSTLRGGVKYQWQICYDVENDLWINIHGEDSAKMKLSYGMITTLADETGTAYVRVVSTSAGLEAVSDSIPVTVAQAQPQRAIKFAAPRAVDSDVTDTVSLTIEFVYGINGEAVAEPRVYDVQKGAKLSDSFKLPVQEGYSAYLEDDTETIWTEMEFTDLVIEEDTTITFYYWPAKVNYTVIYYWQQADSDNYSEHERYTAMDFTGAEIMPEDRSYEGFYLSYIESVPLASDGSTVINVYFDREYYKMMFQLGGGYGVEPIYARYGTQLKVPNPVRADHLFVGWDDVTDGTGNGIQDLLPETLPAYHTTWEAIWKMEKPTVTVTIVLWGQNANNNHYSHITSQEIEVKPGTVLDFGSGEFICGLEEHQHGLDCEYDCGLEPHEHSLAENCYELDCNKTSHNHQSAGCTLNCKHVHTTACYQARYGNLVQTTIPANADPKHTENNIFTYTTRNWTGTTTNYVVKIGDQWWGCQYGNNYQITFNCDHDNHDDDCYTCGEKNGTHTHSLANGCYKLICTTQLHDHTAECYSCIEHTHTDNCYLTTDRVDSKLWVYNAEKTAEESDGALIATPGQANIINAYYDRTEFTLEFRKSGSNNNDYGSITTRWGANILPQYNAIKEKAGGILWSKSKTSTSNMTYTSYFGVMPKPYTGDNGNLVNKETYYLYTTSGRVQQGLVYYLQQLDGTYKEDFRLEWTAGSSYTVSEEDFFVFEGYEINEGKSANLKDQCSGYPEFFYDRKAFSLTINDSKENLDPIYIPYEAAISDYLNFIPDPPDTIDPDSVEFDGWYLEEHYGGEKFDPSKEKMPADNLMLYAKWKPIECTVRFYLDEKQVGTENVYQATVDGETITYQYTILHGGHIQDPYTPPGDPAKGQYQFVGWFFKNEQGVEILWDFNETKVTGDTDIYAKWNSNVSVDYTVRFVWVNENGQEVEIAEPITGKARGGTSKTFEAKGGTRLYADFQEGYFPSVKSHTIVMDLDNPENNTFTFYYTKEDSVPYTVYYINAETGENLRPPVVVADNKKAAVTENYVRIEGYLPDKHQQTLIVIPGQDNEIIFSYTKDEVNGMYLVHYWVQNEDGTGYTEDSVFEGRAEKGTKVDAAVKGIEHFVFNESHPDNVVSGTISVDNVLELHMYYDRNQYPYKVQYFEQYTNRELLPTKMGMAYWDSSVREFAAPVGTGALEHFTLISAPEISIEIAYDLVENTTVNVVTFYYAENRVNLNYAAGEGGAVNPETESVKISSGAAKGSTATAADGYVFEGWYGDSNYTDLISLDPEFVPTKDADALWVDGTTYYAKFKRSITSMTIQVTGSETIDENQTFLFRITGADGVDMTVTVHGNSATTVTGVVVGNEYTITQLDGSWRYTPDAAQKTITPAADPDANTIMFAQTRTEKQWLDSGSWLDNLIRGQNN